MKKIKMYSESIWVKIYRLTFKNLPETTCEIKGKGIIVYLLFIFAAPLTGLVYLINKILGEDVEGLFGGMKIIALLSFVFMVIGLGVMTTELDTFFYGINELLLLLILYLSPFVVGLLLLISILIVVGIIAGIVYCVIELKKKYKDDKDDKDDSEKKKTQSIFGVIYNSLKNRFCSKIEWWS